MEEKRIEDFAEHYPIIDDGELERLRRRIGVKIGQPPQPWVEEANRDAIRHYAHGIGDANPLWCDPEYAGRSRHGGLIAPPTFLFATSRIVSGYVGGLPGIHAMFAGADWTFLRPVPVGTRITTECWLKDLVEHQTRFAGRAIQQIYHVDFYGQEGDHLAACDSWCFRTERATAREQGEKYRERPAPKVYSDDEVRAIAERYAAEAARGPTPLYWEDVREGEALPPIQKGPMTVTGFIAYVQGWGGLYIGAHRMAFETYRRHPGLGIPNHRNIPDVPERVHWEPALAQAVGVPDAYDYGPERVSWMGHLMTNWVGDDGWLHRLHAKVVRHNPVGDVLTISGKVTRKYRHEKEGRVDCDLLAVNQDGEQSCVAEATAILPRREAGD